ncbi:MAG: hypothetical protein K8I29_12785 [Alphaproteobacteria bacterium]|uniref:Uncharacterized protein n=1 Tax=Candidatus Nitrobium versatile TaxID=2884831 RepID=A0A953J7E1_9BACT|nr:hypothetical protein [Candidatus Nitrobium versatile]
MAYREEEKGRSFIDNSLIKWDIYPNAGTNNVSSLPGHHTTKAGGILS